MLLVIDIPTNRIIYYTTDNTEPLVLTKNSVIATYSGPWPEEITPTTSWNWVYIDGTIKHAITYKNETGLSVLEINRASFKTSLVDRITSIYNEYTNIDIVKEVLTDSNSVTKNIVSTIAKSTGDTVENVLSKYSGIYQEYLDKVRCIEFIRERFNRAFSLANSNSELIFLKNILDAIKISPKYVDSKERYLISTVGQYDVLEFLQEISLLDNSLWSDKKIDSQQEPFIIQVIKAVPTPNKEYPENIWNSLSIEKTDTYNALPKLMAFLENFATARQEKLSRVMITKLPENEDIPWSIDIGEYYTNKKRFHLCLASSYELSVLDKAVVINPGDLIMLDNKMPHMSQQFGSGDRLAIVFDTESV